MTKPAVVISAAIIILMFIAGGLVTRHILDKQKEVHEKEIQAGFKRREMELETRLQDSESARARLGLRFDSLATRFDSLARVDSVHVVALGAVKGKFNSLTSKQLESKMLEEYNKRN